MCVVAPQDETAGQLQMVLQVPFFVERVFRRSRPLGRVAALLMGVVGVLAPGAGALGQAIDCGQLQAQIAGLPRADTGNVARYVQAAQKQRAEIDRTANYARSLGCDRQQFLFFGSPPPQQCGPIGARLQQMQANLAQINAQIQRLGGGVDSMRRDLTARYNAYCRDGRPRGFFDRLFGVPDDDDQELDDAPETLDAQEATPHGGPKAVCVRTCDGYFFPVSYSATQGQLGSLADLCQALCPNAQTELFTYSMSRDIDDSVSASTGQTYKSMSYADKYKTKVDSSCACRAPNQSWVQALANAEAMLSKAKSDIIVTPEKSDEMARPKMVKVKPASAVKTAPARRESDEDPLPEEAAGSPPPADSGIAAGTIAATKSYGRHDGVESQTPGPDGVTRRVRVIGPKL
jgi:hypothetical protein